MRKFVAVLIILLYVTGCKNNKNIICKINIKNETLNYEFMAKYKIYYRDNKVLKIVKEEKYVSDDKKTLKYFNDFKKLEYDNSNDLYGGFDYSIVQKNDIITIKTIIDISNTDLGKMVSLGYINSDYVINNTLTPTGIKYFYEERGASCE